MLYGLKTFYFIHKIYEDIFYCLVNLIDLKHQSKTSLTRGLNKLFKISYIKRLNMLKKRDRLYKRKWLRELKRLIILNKLDTIKCI